MIIQALNQYYDILSQDEQSLIPRLGYSSAKVSFILHISTDGELSHIIDTRVKGKTTKPKDFIVPMQDTRTSGVFPYFLCDNSKYVFGVEKKNQKERKEILDGISDVQSILEDTQKELIVVTERSNECFEAFKVLHHRILDNIQIRESIAFLKFLDTWNPINFIQNAKTLEYKEELLNGVNFIFSFEQKYLHTIKIVQESWEKYCDFSSSGQELISQCLVSGDISPISKTHNLIKGVYDPKNAKGASLISFNKIAFESYGKEKSFNAPIGTTAEFKYTTVLNHLLADPKHKIRVADSTVVFWAETSERGCEDLALSLFNPPIGSDEKEDETPESTDQRVKDEKTIQLIRDILTKVRNSQPLDPETIGADPETRFYILGLSPNNARLAVRFWYRDSFGHFVKRIAQHHLDLEIVKGDYAPPYLSVFRLLKETIPKSSEKGDVSPLLGGLMLNAILNGTQYPVQMYYAILNRVKVEREINYARAGFIKAYLLRLCRTGSTTLQENMITMSLNVKSQNVPYRLGRLFAVLEKVQSETNKEMGSTITSKYFSSASATPAVVFPVLLKLAQHHIAKSDWGFKTNQAIEEILSGVDAFPAFLNLEDQGMFMLGFYHQKQAFFVKKENSKEE